MALYEKYNLKIYNPLSGTKEVFTSKKKGYVGMYVCGPTVYNYVHIGNCRTFIYFDLVFRYLKYLGYKVRYVRNITDVGHLENDSDEGNDKIIKKAKLEKIEPMEVAQKYTLYFRNILRKLNNIPPSIEPTATGHIPEQIQLIEKILSRGFAYIRNGSVYFDVLKYNESHNYGTLSGRNIEELLNHSRILNSSSDKKNPQDFALWKKADQDHIMKWSSPWGIGFPGWHIECSSMSYKYLGENFDIHGGGIDLKFPHHECEIAQSIGSNGISPVNYWMHTNSLNLNGKKMEKSQGHFITPEEIFNGTTPFLSSHYEAPIVRLFILQSHYRSVLDFSDKALKDAEKNYDKLWTAIDNLKHVKTETSSELPIEEWVEKCHAAINDDFNTPLLIALLLEGAKMANKVTNKKAKIDAQGHTLLYNTLKTFLKDILGIKPKKKGVKLTQKNALLNLILATREKARENENYAISDFIRTRLEELNIKIQDKK